MLFQMDPGDNMAENKLLLLYIFHKLNMPLTNIQLIDIIQQNGLMNYFVMHMYVQQLVGSGYLQALETDGVIRYSITISGEEVLGYFIEKLHPGIKLLIDRNCTGMRHLLVNKKSISADFTPVDENEFVVQLKISESDFDLIDLRLTVGTRKDAQTICSNWKHNAQDLYLKTIQSLTRDVSAGSEMDVPSDSE